MNWYPTAMDEKSKMGAGVAKFLKPLYEDNSRDKYMTQVKSLSEKVVS